jgi:hypothetical protein
MHDDKQQSELEDRHLDAISALARHGEQVVDELLLSVHALVHLTLGKNNREQKIKPKYVESKPNRTKTEKIGS